MGLIRTQLTLKNPRRPEVPPLEVSALVGTGAVHLCIPPQVCAQLQLDKLMDREVFLADGKKHEVPYVGPVEMTFKNRAGYTGALVLGDEVLLGSIPMEDMDLVIIPRTQMLDVNPASPNIATSIVKVATVSDRS